MSNVIKMVMWPLFSGLVVIMFMYAGILYLTANGDPSRLTKAKSAVIWAVAGIAVGILAYSAQSLIGKILGV